MNRKSTVLKKRLILALICVMAFMAFAGCGKKKKLHYGETKGVVSGNITFSDKGAEFNLDNVIAPAGADIDYTSGIVKSGEGADYSLEVNASNVKYDKPGTYTANYTVKSGEKTYTDSIKVTITDNEKSGDDNSNGNNSVNDVNNVDNQDSSLNNSEQINEPQGNQGGNNTVQNNSGNQNNNSNQNNIGTDSNPSKPTDKKVLITNGETIKYENKNIPNAVIELLSGDVVTISCSTSKYIVSTRTEETQEQRDGHNYKITKLIVTFNTGNEQTLETIEKRMD